MSTQPAEANTSGWVEFAAVMMFAVALFRIITAIAYFADSQKINDLTNGLFSGHVWAWGLWDMLIAAVAILAGISLLENGGFGRVLGYIFGVLAIVQGFTVVGLAPWYAALAVATGALVVYGIARTPRTVLS